MRRGSSGLGPGLALCLALCLASLAPPPASAEELTKAFVAENGALPVSRVEYEGNSRTKRAALDELAGIRPGMALSEIDPEAARQRLLKAGIFGEVRLDAEIEEAGVVVTVAVKEKWTLIPIPSGYYGSDGWSFGFDLIDYNFMGMRRTLVLGGSDSNLGLSGTAAYIDPRFLGSKTELKAFASYGVSTEEARYMDDEAYASFDLTTAAAGIYLEYPSESALSGSVELTLRYAGVDEGAVALYPELREEALYLVPGLGLAYDGRSYSGYHESGPAASLAYDRGIGLRDEPAYDSVEASAELMLGAFFDGLATLGAIGKYGSRPFQALGALSGSGYRTLPQGYSYSAKNAAAYASLELPFARPSWCVMTLGAFYELGIYATGLEGGTTDIFQGPGLSYRLYLAEIALPAVGIDAAYNLPRGTWIFSAYLGVSL